MDISIEQQCINLIKSEVIPATGCTEPVAVALAAAKASHVLGEEPKEIEVLLSANMLKNAMGVGIPGTGMIGLPIAIALGIVIAQPEKELTVLEDFSEEHLNAAKLLVEKKIISIKLKEGEVDKLYIEVNLRGEDHTSSVIILSNHRNIIFVERDNKVLFGQRATVPSASNKEEEKEQLQLTFGIVYDFATTTPLEKIEFIMEAARLNQAASEYSLKSTYGHAVGRMIQGELGKKYLGTSSLTEMLTYTSAACDARMDGAPVTVMSNSGSGNQGITATLPVLTFARKENKSHEETVRALVLSNLMVIYVKQKLGRLSALCGCVVAATGSSCGLTYLMGGTRDQVGFAIKNMVGNITGMLCDGAKPSCSMKVSSGVSTAMFSALLAMEHKVVTSNEGIVDDDVDRTVDNLTGIGRVGMNETDKLVLDIMTKKQQ
ncbi:L-cysteine desulfidase family protein [Porphyromonas circumdentaria]|uniref:UPF0597 protein SAMN02745171_00373 n=1 Tax=Porphyromonas circumdentaria TaxID=29524 RepID=A0A1T4LDG9_9PORP|nr:L-serine ammonia-lyase, iron-sulfur-dependent, subunit alpha [Porphyromonas circumdentaria]MBB6275304.1 L-cysteine desulfidase [Porphyromonas circumdentaria]MDO4722017.1 L-serine ammonia-lyase, iron-sulfur-dependent, subunit alpha [Porphyromonas circumdentaria]SJZ52671.1 L-cysteine desulfidase [Porphyromonas circumdentaria]